MAKIKNRISGAASSMRWLGVCSVEVCRYLLNGSAQRSATEVELVVTKSTQQHKYCKDKRNFKTSVDFEEFGMIGFCKLKNIAS